MTSRSNLRWVRSSRNNKELAERYDQWAGDYDAEMDRDYGYRVPQMAAGVFARHVPREAKVLDAGAGTGLVGEALSRRGYRNLVAMDLSGGMLKEAQSKGVYQESLQMVMGESLGFARDSFDAVVCVGAIGYAPANSLEELVRITRPGGHIVFTLRPNVYEDSGFKELQRCLELEGKWKLAEVSEKFQVQPKRDPDAYQQVWAYQVISSTPGAGAAQEGKG